MCVCCQIFHFYKNSILPLFFIFPRQNADDSMDQETSQSLIPLSQTQDPGSSIADSSQSKPWD